MVNDLKTVSIGVKLLGPRHKTVVAGLSMCFLGSLILLIGALSMELLGLPSLNALTLGLPLGILGIALAIQAFLPEVQPMKKNPLLLRTLGRDYRLVVTGMLMQITAAVFLVVFDYQNSSEPIFGFLTFLFALIGLLMSILWYGVKSRASSKPRMLSRGAIKGLALIVVGRSMLWISDEVGGLDFFDLRGVDYGMAMLGISTIVVGFLSVLLLTQRNGISLLDKLSDLFSKEESSRRARERAEIIIQEMKRLNQEGVQYHHEGNYPQAAESFKLALKSARQGKRLRSDDTLTELTGFISTLGDSISESLKNAQAGIAQQEMEQEMARLVEEINRLETSEMAPLDIKRDASRCESDVMKLHKRSKQFGFENVGEICLKLLNRIRDITRRADENLMGGIVGAQAVSEPTLAQGVTTAAPAVADSTVQERYQVAQLIAEGGMAQVFMATDKESGQKVVWKQAYGKHNPLAVSNQKLLDEAELLQLASHPRIPTYLAHGEIVQQGVRTAVLVQEYIEGGDLKNTVEQVKKMGMSLPLDKVVDILAQICEPLEYMAALPEPVYHRDLKPHNIIVHPKIGPVLIDFGLAKMVASGEDVSITRGGSGTWSPPERDSGVSGPFTDVYSLGKILYYLLTNESPRAILGPSEVQQVTEAGSPKWVSQLILKAADPRQQDRIQSVAWFRKMLQSRGDWDAVQADKGAASDDFTTWG